MIVITVITCQATDFKSALISAKIIESSFKPRASTITFNRTRYEAMGVTPVIGDAVSVRLSDGTASYKSVGVMISNISSDVYTVTWELKDNWYSVYNEAYQTSWTVAKLGCDAFEEISRNTFSHSTYIGKHTTVNVNAYNTLAKKKGPCIRDILLICMSSATTSNWLVLLQYYGLQPTIWTDTDNLADKGTISQSSSTARLISADWDDCSKYNVKYVTVKYNGGTSTGSQSSSAVTGTLTVSNNSISNSTDADNYRNGLLKVYDVARKNVKLQCVILATANIPNIYDWYDVSDSTTGKSGTDLRVLEYEYTYPSGLFTLTMSDVPLLPSETGTTTTDRLNAIELGESSPIERVASKLTLDNTVDCVLTADASGGLLINGVLITGTGDVIKSGSSAANQIPKWVGTGYTLAASGITIDSSNNLAGIGSIGHEGHILPGSTNTWDLGSSSKIYNEAFIGNPYMSSFRSLDTSSLDATVQVAQNGTNNVWLRFRMSGSSQESGILLSNYDSGHFFECASSTNIVWKYNTTIDYAASTQIMNLTSGGILTVNGLTLEGGTYDCGLTSNTVGQMLIEGQYGTTTIGMGNASYTHFQTDGTSGFAFNNHMILYNSNLYDIGNATYAVRNLYLGTGLYMGGTQFVDSSRNISNIGTLYCTAIGINETPIANKACFDLSASSYGNMQLGNPSAGESSICYIGNATTYGSSPASSSGNTYIWVAGHGCWTNNGKYVIGSVGRTGSAGPVLILDTNGLLDLPVIGTTSSQGIKIGGDVNLYRSAANVLKTDDSFTCASATVGSTAIPAASPTGQFLRDDCTWQTCSGSGTLTGPASSTANAIVKWSNTGGIQTLNSGVTIDSSNNVSTTGRISATSNQCFSAFRTGSSQSISATTSTTIVFNTEDYDNGACYNNSTGVFTAPVTGKYLVNVNLYIYTVSDGQVDLYIDDGSANTQAQVVEYNRHSASTSITVRLTAILQLTGSTTYVAGVYCSSASTVNQSTSPNHRTYFQVQYLGA